MASLGLEQADSPYMAVFNNALTDIPAGVAVVLDTAGGGALFDTWVRLPTDAEANLVPVGLTTLPIKTKDWGNVTVRPGMRVPCVAGAAVTKGVYVKASSVAGQNGRIIAAADGDAYVGSALNAAAAAGDPILVLFGKGSHALGLNTMATFKMLMLNDDGTESYQNAEFTPNGMLKLGNETLNLDFAARDVHGEEFLANIAFGFNQKGAIWRDVVPTLTVDYQSDKYYEWDKEDAYEEAVRINTSSQAEPPEFSPRFGQNRYQVTPYAASFFLHTEAVANSDAMLNLQMAHMNRIMKIMDIASELRTQTLLQASTSYDSSQTLILDANTTWLNTTTGQPGANSNPVKDLLTLQETALLDVSQWIFNPTVYNAFILHPETQKYIINKSGTPSLPNPDQLMGLFEGLFGIAPIKKAKMKRLGSGGTHPFIWNNTAVGIHYPEGTPTGQDSTTAYRFRWNGAGDSPLRGFSQRDGFFVRTIPIDHRGMLGGYRTMLFTYEDLKLISTFGGCRIANAVAAF